MGKIDQEPKNLHDVQVELDRWKEAGKKAIRLIAEDRGREARAVLVALDDDTVMKNSGEEDLKKMAKKGEKMGAQGFVKTYGFEHSMAFLMQFAEAVCKTASEHKSFRMELMYDAEALNADYVFFVPTESGSDDKSREFPKGQDCKVHPL